MPRWDQDLSVLYAREVVEKDQSERNRSLTVRPDPIFRKNQATEDRYIKENHVTGVSCNRSGGQHLESSHSPAAKRPFELTTSRGKKDHEPPPQGEPERKLSGRAKVTLDESRGLASPNLRSRPRTRQHRHALQQYPKVLSRQ